MEQVESISFSGLISGILLYKTSYTSVELVNIISKLESMGIIIDDENYDLDELACCVQMSSSFCFCLKNGLGYDSILSMGTNVYEFLIMHTNERTLSILERNFENILPQRKIIINQVIAQNEEVVNKGKFLKVLSKRKFGYGLFPFSRENRDVSQIF